ncbi:hypothetical protein CEUSTIGMA_g10673.t1 [Chlamydomonas eustigma]|uniref:SET domain-containing protein n=1 Tax=Chlamydomonas eustigma TaxID=1157962 RepID=A0A250XJJ7_9CHLO|nr:hypothetical protein CEUSTIGMA_g10673.t1 [Chlamydomonas eustigma]|eukprot:GAX83247.1 hypothetical protein CEUSTIGMA_g10673.t1 [Chlamydomonas eustigma]
MKLRGWPCQLQPGRRVAHGSKLYRRPQNLTCKSSYFAIPENQLEDWLSSKGGLISGVQLQVTGSSVKQRSVIAMEPLEQGRLLISVPLHCQLRYDNIEDPLLLDLLEKVPRGSKNTTTGAWSFKQALSLLWHLSRGTTSPLHPYLATLPGLSPGTSQPRQGMLLGDDVVHELQYTPLIEDVLNQKYWWERFYSDELEPCIQDTARNPFAGKLVSLQLLGWALSVTKSRSFGLSKSGVHTMPAYIDMIDHDADGCNCEVSSDDSGSLNLIATRQIEKGSPLRLKYGVHDNRNLVLSYGFVVPSNPEEKFEFEFDPKIMLDLCDQATLQSGGSFLLAPWQEELLQQLKLISGPSQQVSDCSSTTSSKSSTASTAPPSQPHWQPQPSEQQAGSSSTAVAGTANSAVKASYVYFKAPNKEKQQPVDPRLLAAVRIMMLHGSDQEQVAHKDTVGTVGAVGAVAGRTQNMATVYGLTLEQLGDWEVPVGRQHEIGVLRVLVLLCTALYQSMGSTIQKDKSYFMELESEVQGLLAPEGLVHLGCLGGPADLWDSVRTERLGRQDMVLDTLLAVSFRLGIKTCLERALKAIVQRRKELLDLL